MVRYPALIDGEAGAYGVVFPDLDGVAAMGVTVDEALVNAEESLRDYALCTKSSGEALAVPTPLDKIVVPEGSTLTSVPLLP